MLIGCGGSGSGGTTPPSEEVLSTVTMDADGAGGLDTYTLIRNQFGANPIEAPDLYPANNHAGFQHIQESTDPTVGPHFVFYIHRDLDWDRDQYPTVSDRQRNEIKTYDGSSEALKGRLGETFVIQWKFKINAGMTVSTKFTHLFQLKAVGGDESQPLVTITGVKRSGVDLIEVRHSAATGTSDTIFPGTSWADVRGQWLIGYCKATFSDNGKLYLTVKKLDGTTILAVDQSNIDMWRGTGSEFIRPKWGIYRSLQDLDHLRPAEETVCFANFSVSKVRQL